MKFRFLVQFLSELILVFSLLCFLGFSSVFNPAYAGLADDLQKHFNKLNLPANVTPGGAYDGQTSHYYTPGGMTVSPQDENYKLYNLQKPSISFGDCGEMDVFFGGLSFIDSDQLVGAMKAIGANAQGYLFSLALSQISPSIMGKIQELFALANEFNYSNMDTCWAAKKLVDSGMGVLQGAMNSNCIFSRMDSGDDDYGKAKRRCEDQDTVKKENQKMKSDPKKADAVISDTNITWNAIQNNPILSQLDMETKYLLMTMVGTIIITTDNTVLASGEVDNSPEPKQKKYASKLTDEMIKRLSEKGEVVVYVCKDSTAAGGCLQMRSEKIKIDEKNTFFGQVKARLEKLQKNIEQGNKKQPTDEESNELKSFLEISIIPVYKILAVESAFTRGNRGVINITNYTNLISMEILYKFLNQGITDVMDSLADNMLPKIYQDDMVKMALYARNQIEKIQITHMEKIRTVNDIILRVSFLEKQLMSGMSDSLSGNMNWEDKDE